QLLHAHLLPTGLPAAHRQADKLGVHARVLPMEPGERDADRRALVAGIVEAQLAHESGPPFTWCITKLSLLRYTSRPIIAATPADRIIVSSRAAWRGDRSRPTSLISSASASASVWSIRSAIASTRACSFARFTFTGGGVPPPLLFDT